MASKVNDYVVSYYQAMLNKITYNATQALKQLLTLLAKLIVYDLRRNWKISNSILPT